MGVGLTLLTLGWRGARGPFTYLLVGWQVVGFADSLYSAVTRPEDFRFRGETLGVDFSLAWVAPALYGGALALSLSWFVSERGNRLSRAPGWSARNIYWLAALAAALPVQFFLFRFGTPYGITDKLGVLLTILQWFLSPLALRPTPRDWSH